MWSKRPGAPVEFVRGRPVYLWPVFPRWREAELEKQIRAEVLKERSAGQNRLELARAQLAEFEVAKRRATWIPVDDALRSVEKMLGMFRARLLGIPQRWAPSLVHVDTVTEMERRLDAAVRELMEVLSAPNLTPAPIARRSGSSSSNGHQNGEHDA